jgi:hypothetical protein
MLSTIGSVEFLARQNEEMEMQTAIEVSSIPTYFSHSYTPQAFLLPLKPLLE